MIRGIAQGIATIDLVRLGNAKLRRRVFQGIRITGQDTAIVARTVTGIIRRVGHGL